jgi:S1-C subfamily serine protease
MPIVISCPSCKAKLKAPDNAVGKAVKCPGCGTAIAVRAGAGAEAPAPAAKGPAPRREAPTDDMDFDRDEAPRRGGSRRPVEDDEDDRPRKPAAYLGVGFDLDTDDLVILDVYENSPAEKAGLEPDDVIVRVDGEKVKQRKDLAEVLGSLKPGDKVEIDVRRKKDIETVDVKLGKRPAD